MRHNDYPATLLMEPAANDEPSRYRMTPAASTMREWSAPLAPVMAYREACYEFERGDHAPSMKWVGVDVAGGPGRSATVTYTRTGSTVRIDTVFTTPAPQLATALPTAKTEPEADSRIGRRVVAIEGDRRYFAAGDAGVVIGVDYDGDLMVRFDPSPTSEPGPFWYVCPENVRFTDTLAPAAQEYLVCIKAMPHIHVGHVLQQIGGEFDPAYWARCDADGWISHTPTADAVCPVPDGVEFETRRRNGRVIGMDRLECLWQTRTDVGHAAEPTAWRPIQA